MFCRLMFVSVSHVKLFMLMCFHVLFLRPGHTTCKSLKGRHSCSRGVFFFIYSCIHNCMNPEQHSDKTGFHRATKLRVERKEQKEHLQIATFFRVLLLQMVNSSLPPISLPKPLMLIFVKRTTKGDVFKSHNLKRKDLNKRGPWQL